MSLIDLRHGNCLDILPSIEDNSIHAIICDLPYGTTQCWWDNPLDLTELWTHYERVLAKDGVILLFAAQPFTSHVILSKPTLFKYLWYWEREKGTNFLSTGYQPLRVIEEICVFAPNAQFTYNPQMVLLDKPYRHTMPIKKSDVAGSFRTEGSSEKREYKTYTHSHPKNLVKFARDNANKSLIPTQKPLALLEYLIKTYTNAGDTVLDNTMGSGTCGVACKMHARNFIGMELNEAHFRIAEQRIANTLMPLDLFSKPNSGLDFGLNLD